MGAISKRNIIEKSPLTTDVDQELNRLNEGTSVKDVTVVNE